MHPRPHPLRPLLKRVARPLPLRRRRLRALSEDPGEFTGLAVREQNAAFYPNIAGTIAGRGRSGDNGKCRGRRKQKFAHLETLLLMLRKPDWLHEVA